MSGNLANSEPWLIGKRVRLHRDPAAELPLPVEYDGRTGTLVLLGWASGSYAVRLDGEPVGRWSSCWVYPKEMEALDEPLRFAAETDG